MCKVAGASSSSSDEMTGTNTGWSLEGHRFKNSAADVSFEVGFHPQIPLSVYLHGIKIRRINMN